MRTLGRCLWAELLKLKRTPAIMIVVVAPYLVVLVPFLIVVTDGDRFLPSSVNSSWVWLSRSAFSTWCTVVFPLALGVVAAVCADVEHRTNGFRHMFSLQASRWTIYMAKQAALLCLTLLAFVLLAGGVAAGGTALSWMRPGLGFEEPLPWLLLWKLVVLGVGASAFVVALQQWVALATRSFAAPIGVAALATATLLLVRTLGSDWETYHPWSYAAATTEAALSGATDLRSAMAGLVTGLVFAGFAGFSFCRQDVS